MFPTPEDSLLGFFLRGSFGQFLLTMREQTMAVIVLVLFLIGLALILASNRQQGWGRAAAMFALLSVPFLLACAGAYSRTYPFGQTRQTVHIAVFIAIGAGIALDKLTFRRASVTLAIAALFVPAWYRAANYNPITTESWADRTVFHAMVEHIQRKIPKGSHLWCEDSVFFILYSYYLARVDSQELKQQYPGSIGGYYPHSQARVWRSFDDVWEKLPEWRGRDDVSNSDTVWVVDAQECALCQVLRREPKERPPWFKPVRFRDQGLIFEMPVDYQPPDPGDGDQPQP
jgi:hypothetical protein